MNIVQVALRRKRDRLCSPEQSANAKDSWAVQFLQPVSDAPHDLLVAAWLPTRTGQAVPMIGEEVGYVEPCDSL